MTSTTENIQQEKIASPLDALKSAAGTDVGRKREENQDSFGIIEREDSKIYIVADGMGGAKGGAVASKLSIETIRRSLESVKKVTVDILAEAILEANDTIFQKSLEDSSLSGMGTTLVAFLFSGTSLHFLHVGDSRAYRIRRGAITKLTEDHTLVAELVRAGAITEDQAEHHPVSHMLTRSLGPSSEVAVDKKILSDGPIRGDRYLLCSDGLYNMLSEVALNEIIASGTLDESIEKLLADANANGGTDNITALLIEVGDSYPVGIEDITSDMSSLYETKEEKRQEKIDSTNISNNTSAPKDHSHYSERPHAFSIYARRGALAFFFLLLGMVLGPLLMRQSDHVGASTENHKPTVLSPLALSLESNFQPKQAKLSTMLYESTPELLQEVKSQSNELLLSKEEKENIEKRKRALGDKITLLDERLALFRDYSSQQISEILLKNTSYVEELQSSITRLKERVDIASRLLSAWLGRKRRLETEDVLSLATEVSVTVPEIKAKKEEFEGVTWEYLKATEDFRSTPQDKTLESKISDLVALRKEKIGLLTEALRGAIDASISTADKQMSELTLEKQQREEELKIEKGKVDFLKVLSGSSPESKSQLKIALESERQSVVKEYAELAAIADH